MSVRSGYSERSQCRSKNCSLHGENGSLVPRFLPDADVPQSPPLSPDCDLTLTDIDPDPVASVVDDPEPLPVSSSVPPAGPASSPSYTSGIQEGDVARCRFGMCVRRVALSHLMVSSVAVTTQTGTFLESLN